MKNPKKPSEHSNPAVNSQLNAINPDEQKALLRHFDDTHVAGIVNVQGNSK
jgi:hypothetical protein